VFSCPSELLVCAQLYGPVRAQQGGLRLVVWLVHRWFCHTQLKPLRVTGRTVCAQLTVLPIPVLTRFACFSKAWCYCPGLGGMHVILSLNQPVEALLHEFHEPNTLCGPVQSVQIFKIGFREGDSRPRDGTVGER